jgi:hypothetical protein
LGPWLHGQFDRSADSADPLCITQTFELLTGRCLFSPQGGQTRRHEDDQLAKMMELTGETFSEKLLSVSRNKHEYFDNDGDFGSLALSSSMQ